MPGIDQFRSVSHDTAKTETQKLRCKHQRCRLQLSRPGPSPSAWWVMMHKIQFNGWRMTISRIHELCRLSFHRTWKRSRSRYIVAPGKPMTGVEKKTSLRKNSGLAWRAIGISLQHSKPQIGDISENNPVKISLLIRGLFVLSLVRFVKRNVEVYVYSRVTDIKIYQKNSNTTITTTIAKNHTITTTTTPTTTIRTTTIRTTTITATTMFNHCHNHHYHSHHDHNHHYHNHQCHHQHNHHYHKHHYHNNDYHNHRYSQPPLSQPPLSQPPLCSTTTITTIIVTTTTTAWVLYKNTPYKNSKGSDPMPATYFQLYQAHI